MTIKSEELRGIINRSIYLHECSKDYMFSKNRNPITESEKEFEKERLDYLKTLKNNIEEIMNSDYMDKLVKTVLKSLSLVDGEVKTVSFYSSSSSNEIRYCCESKIQPDDDFYKNIRSDKILFIFNILPISIDQLGIIDARNIIVNYSEEKIDIGKTYTIIYDIQNVINNS